jgi:hypothetical protein
LELVHVDVGVRAPESPLGKVSARDAADVAGEEVHAILTDPEVGDEPDIVSKVRATMGCKGEDGGAGIGEATFQLCKSLFEDVEGVLHLAGSLDVGLGGVAGDLSEVADPQVGGVLSVCCQLSKFLCHKDSILGGKACPIIGEKGAGQARGWGYLSQELLDRAVELQRGNVEGGNVFCGEGNLNFWAGGGLEGEGSHCREELIATLLRPSPFILVKGVLYMMLSYQFWGKDLIMGFPGVVRIGVTLPLE